MNVHVDANVRRPIAREIEALAHALHGDPFRVLGPHDTPAGSRRARLPAGRASRVEVLRALGPRARSAGWSAATRAVSGRRVRATRRICCASTGRAACRRPRIPIRSARCSASSTCICSTKGVTSSSPQALGAHVMTIDGVAACALPSGRRTRAASPWSATSTPGTAAAIRCGCAIRAGVWELFVPRVGRARATNTRSSAPAAACCR